MWIFTKTGVLSIVEFDPTNGYADDGVAEHDHSQLMVRSRQAEHLTEVGFSEREIIETPNNDYPFRVITGRERVAQLIMLAVMSIESLQQPAIRHAVRGLGIRADPPRPARNPITPILRRPAMGKTKKNQKGIPKINGDTHSRGMGTMMTRRVALGLTRKDLAEMYGIKAGNVQQAEYRCSWNERMGNRWDYRFTPSHMKAVHALDQAERDFAADTEASEVEITPPANGHPIMPEPKPLGADDDLLKRYLQNTPEGTVITVTIPGRNGSVRFTVK